MHCIEHSDNEENDIFHINLENDTQKKNDEKHK